MPKDSNTPDAIISLYCRLIDSRFFSYHGGIFSMQGKGTRAKVAQDLEQDSRTWRCENDHNHQHFDNRLLTDRVENYYANRKFAVAAQTSWELKIKALTPNPVCCGIVDELLLIEDPAGHYFDLLPTVRVWTPGAADCPLEEMYGWGIPNMAFNHAEAKPMPLADALELVRSSGATERT